MTATLETLIGIDERLAAKGRSRVFGPDSWWLGEAAAFYEHPSAREWWGQIGRGGAKSTVIYRLAVNETLFGNWAVPTGERHWATIASRSKDEAAKGLTIISEDLDTLGVNYTLAGDAIELDGLPRGVRVIAASVGAGSGWRSYFAGHDELAKWPRDGAAAVDAVEVIASMRAMTVTHRAARRLYFSSPFGVVGPHYDRIVEGSNAATVVSVAASWIANPAVITEADTHVLEPNERVWQREYAAIPQAGVASIFRVADIDRARAPRPVDVSLVIEHERVIAFDFSRGGSGDDRVYAVARWIVEETERDPAKAPPSPSGLPWCSQVAPRRRVTWDALTGEPGESWEQQDVAGAWHARESIEFTDRRTVLDVEEIGAIPSDLSTERAVQFLAAVANKRRARGGQRERVRRVFADQYEFSALAVLLRRIGLRPAEEKWSAPSKATAVDRLERLFRDDLIRIPQHEKLRRQLCEYSEKLTRSGAVTYSGSGAHDDFAAVLVTLAMASVAGQLPGDPYRLLGHRHEVP